MPKALSKLFMTSQQTFTCLKSTRESLEVDVVVMFLFLPLNIIHTIFESLLLTLNKKNFYLDSFFSLGNYIYLHRLFSNNKALLSSTRASYMLDAADMSNLFYFHFVFTWSRAMTRLPRSSSTSLARRLCECLCTNLN